MRLCSLTDEQLLAHAANHRKLGNWLGASDAVKATAAGITAAIEELIDRRAEAGNGNASDLERSMAYERCTELIQSHCIAEAAGDENDWWDLESSEQDLGQEIDYLESRRLLSHHPQHPHWVCLLDEDEPLSLGGYESEAAK